MSMSTADEFRQSTEEFWSKMNKKRKAVAGAPPWAPTSSGNAPRKRRGTPATSRPRKRNKH